MTDLNELQADITSTEQGQIKDYIQKHHTAMLTVMFTDIENYTDMTERMGDSYVAELRQHHDNLLKGIIENDDAGLVVKFIGDAVMAVFSEPTVAVQRAMDIQQAITVFNREHEQFENIAVRIGLHLGQIAVEDDLQMDIFGRHVNRAARVEGLAAGGQVLVTYPVWDSAKGWLDSSSSIKCESHGGYQLKGIKEPIDIYEVYMPEFKQPEAPTKGRVKNYSAPLIWVNSFIVLALIFFVTFRMFLGDAVWLKTSVSQPLFINGEVLTLGEVDADGYRPVINELDGDRHELSYKVSSQLGYYANIEVRNGESRLQPKFIEVNLPSLILRNEVSDANGSKVRDFKFSPDASTAIQGSWSIQISSLDNQANVTHDVAWQVSIAAPELIQYSGIETFTYEQGGKLMQFPSIQLGEYNEFNLLLTGFLSKNLINTELRWEFNQ